MKAYLLLADGQLYTGEGFAAAKDAWCELVFNTAMSGYVEAITDPSYAGQGVVMTYPLIGNYGMAAADCESSRPWISAFVVSELSRYASNFRNDTALEAYLTYHGIPGLQGIDTRALTRRLRIQGSMSALITRDPSKVTGPGREFTLAKLAAQNSTAGVINLVTGETAEYSVGGFPDGDGPKIALLDLGAKRSISQKLVKRGARVRAYRQDSPAERILDDAPDGVLLSNGPGDPLDCSAAIENAKILFDSGIPMMGICLGYQILALANGARTKKMRFGHRGGNHPVKDLTTGRVSITSQNHGYVVAEPPPNAEVSHVNVNDGSIEGLRYVDKPVFAVQFHPEASGGPLDTEYLFDEFLAKIKAGVTPLHG